MSEKNEAKGKVVVYVKWITTRDGRKIWAKDYGLKAFRLEIPDRR